MLRQHSRFTGLREYLRVFFSHLWLIVSVVVVVAGAAIVASLVATPTYVAVAKVQAKPSMAAGALGYDERAPEDQGRFLETQKEIVVSTSVAQRTLEKMKDETPEFELEFEKTHGEMSDRQQIAALQRLISVYSRTGEGANTILGASEIGASYIINIAVEFSTAELAAKIANAAAEQYIERYWEMERKDASSQSQFLRTQVDQAEQDLRKAEEALRQFEEQNSQDLAEILNYEKGGVRVYSNLTDFEAAAARLEAEIVRQKSMLDEIRKRQEHIKTFLEDPDKLAQIDERELSRKLFLSPETVAENTSLTAALDRVNALRLQLITLSSTYTDEYRPVQSLRKEIKEGLMIVSDLLDQDLAGREAKRQASMQEKEALQKEIEQYQARLKRLAEQKFLYASLTRAVNVADEIYRTRVGEFERARLGENIRPQDQAKISILDAAYPPLAPTRPNKKLNLALGFVIGLTLAFGLAFLVDSWDHSIKTVYDVERHLDVPVVAAISRQRAG